MTKREIFSLVGISMLLDSRKSGTFHVRIQHDIRSREGMCISNQISSIQGKSIYLVSFGSIYGIQNFRHIRHVLLLCLNVLKGKRGQTIIRKRKMKLAAKLGNMIMAV